MRTSSELIKWGILENFSKEFTRKIDLNKSTYFNFWVSLSGRGTSSKLSLRQKWKKITYYRQSMWYTYWITSCWKFSSIWNMWIVMLQFYTDVVLSQLSTANYKKLNLIFEIRNDEGCCCIPSVSWMCHA